MRHKWKVRFFFFFCKTYRDQLLFLKNPPPPLFFFLLFIIVLSQWDFSRGKFGLLSSGKASCNRVALPSLIDYRIFNVCTDFNACNCTRECTDTVKESALKLDSGRKSPAASGNRTYVSSVPDRRCTNWATSSPHLSLPLILYTRFVLFVVLFLLTYSSHGLIIIISYCHTCNLK